MISLTGTALFIFFQYLNEINEPPPVRRVPIKPLWLLDELNPEPEPWNEPPSPPLNVTCSSSK